MHNCEWGKETSLDDQVQGNSRISNQFLILISNQEVDFRLLMKRIIDILNSTVTCWCILFFFREKRLSIILYLIYIWLKLKLFPAEHEIVFHPVYWSPPSVHAWRTSPCLMAADLVHSCSTNEIRLFMIKSSPYDIVHLAATHPQCIDIFRYRSNLQSLKRVRSLLGTAMEKQWTSTFESSSLYSSFGGNSYIYIWAWDAFRNPVIFFFGGGKMLTAAQNLDPVICGCVFVYVFISFLIQEHLVRPTGFINCFLLLNFI